MTIIRASLLACAVAVAGCNAAGEASFRAPEPDQCLRVELFKACMAALPAGPAATKYNDWAEVVEECESAAFKQSLRTGGTVKAECSRK